MLPMRRAALYGLVVVCVCVLFALSGPSAQRMITGDSGGSTTTPVPVAVNNFPAVQTVQGNVAVDKTVNVTGSVAVTNLPAVQQVVGTVNVANLPVDGSGRLLVSVQNGGSSALTLHSTSATFPGATRGDLLAPLGGRTGATQACQVEFPGSHWASSNEIRAAITNGKGVVWLTSDTSDSWLDDFVNDATCSVGCCDRVVLFARAQGVNELLVTPINSLRCDTSALPLVCADQVGS
jgi:hypothetical protein